MNDTNIVTKSWATLAEVEIEEQRLRLPLNNQMEDYEYLLQESNFLQTFFSNSINNMANEFLANAYWLTLLLWRLNNCFEWILW